MVLTVQTFLKYIFFEDFMSKLGFFKVIISLLKAKYFFCRAILSR